MGLHCASLLLCNSPSDGRGEQWAVTMAGSPAAVPAQLIMCPGHVSRRMRNLTFYLLLPGCMSVPEGWPLHPKLSPALPPCKPVPSVHCLECAEQLIQNRAQTRCSTADAQAIIMLYKL